MGQTTHTDTGLEPSPIPSQDHCTEGHLYRPHGRFASTYGLRISSKSEGIPLKGFVHVFGLSGACKLILDFRGLCRCKLWRTSKQGCVGQTEHHIYPEEVSDLCT